jgi:2-oxoglutarate ferredoxin oxidoreductase subunit gamma
MTAKGLYHEVLIAGFGGQGVVLAGRLLASAALAEGRQVVWAPSYGPEMRGGPVHCTVVVSSRSIGSPEVSRAHSLLIMDRASLERFRERVKPGGLFVLNSTLVPTPPETDTCEILSIPATEVAERLGDARVANVIMLGAFLQERPIVATASIEDPMRLLAGKRHEHLIAVNRQALASGADLAQEAHRLPSS